ncbi:aspartyl aminopeptidase [Cantharellus anzutake]|uniref:aspartyl aminopeptidase n=1 Tax=Cantharellus anzutake TaxID=1750568 RepID=UPI0019038942|nr:aspartyl aminopeptidase [Cantharellus anzutake]KAF8341629.1 aspartyl aminopeptidase [Cantharellus anzutake]
MAPNTGAAQRFITFVNASPTPFHAVRNAASRLEKSGFVKLHESDANWDSALKGGGKFYYTRNQSSLIALTVPIGFKPGSGVSIVGTHTDSPNLRIRPVSKKSNVGYLQVACELYGGGIWHTWFDRDLSIAGRVITTDDDGGFSSRLVKVDRPILRIPTLAIHLDRSVNTSLQFNKETEFVPILSLINEQLNAPKKHSSLPKGSSISNNHHPELISLLAKELNVSEDHIHDFELRISASSHGCLRRSLYDTQPSTLGGLNDEFIFSPRLDNLMSTFCAVEAICESVSSENFARVESSRAGQVNVIACFNHEEVGSVSASGAQGSLVPQLLSRLSPTPSLLSSSIAHSLLISADMGHAVHPNHSSKHEENHRPKLNGGVVIKTNADQRYSTDAIGTFLVRQLIEKRGGNVQEFEVRNDMSCGSTIGPALSKIGVRVVDVGTPMLSMHSIRETAGSADVDSYITLFGAFFEGFANLDKSLPID